MSGKMLIKRLVIDGEKYRRTLGFTNGLNVIEGEMYSGKSLILNLIDYLLGRDTKFKENVQIQLREYCDNVSLEIELDNQVITIRRNLWKNTSDVLIYFCHIEDVENYSPRILNLQEYYDFLLEKLHIQQHKLLKHKAHSTERIVEKLSFRDLMRYLYIDQHALGTKYFMKFDDSTIRRKNKLVFDVIFGFIEYDEQNILDDIKNTINEIEKIKRQIEGLKSYVQEMKLGSKVELQKVYSEYENEIKETIKAKDEIIGNASKKNSRIDKVYSRTKKKSIEVSNNIYNLRDKQKDLTMTILSKQTLLHDYNREMKELVATKEAYEILTKQNHKYSCPICSTQLNYDSTSKVNVSSIDELIYQLKLKIEMIEKSIESTVEKAKELKKEENYLEEESNILERALGAFEDKIEAPYISEIECINKILRELQQAKDRTNEGIKILNKIEEKNEFIRELNVKLKELEDKQKKLRVSDEEKKNIMKDLNITYRDILKDLHLEAGILDSFIDEDAYKPVYKNASVTEHDSGGVLACMQIAYLSTILQNENSINEFNHPGFLMFDTIGKYLGTYLEQIGQEYTEDMIMDPFTYERLYELFINLSENFQLFIVDNIPHSIARPYVQYTFYHHGLKGLIDLSKNEKCN
jgi:hypothetical protein